MRPTDVNSNHSLRQYLEESECEVRSIGTVLGGYEVLCAAAGGTKDPAIVITAGSHADELGGVYGALALLREIETEHRLYVIPVRDPFGFEGYRASLHHAIGQETPIHTPADIYQLFREQGTILYEQGTYVIAILGGVVFAYDVGVDFTTSSVGRQIDILVLEDAHLLTQLVEASRVMAPWNLPMPRWATHLSRPARSMIVKPNGFVGNMNRFFDVEDAPPEVKIQRAFVEEVNPGLVLDLHEGYGRGFYVYKSSAEEPLSNRVVARMGPAVEAHGGQTATPAELHPDRGPSLGADRTYFGNGVFYSGSSTLSSFGNFCQARTTAFTLETGGLNPVNWRGDLHTWASLAAIAEWEKAIQEG